MEEFYLIQGPIVSNFRLNIGTDAVTAGTFIAVLVFKGITIVVTNNVIIIISVGIVYFDGNDIKRGMQEY
jgi:hypothetical protein